ncbi:MAG: HAMP domain-containing sensor histidine kinase [Eubacteriales bacterium]|nr:HAMP domain-containing sensor histidine kinase [Eubacteriales bacterium]
MAVYNVIFGCIALLCAIYALHGRFTEKRMLHKLDAMLDEAISGSFSEQDFDESLLSSVETKLAQYLAASAVSEKNLCAEKDKIKTLIADISHQTKTPIANILLYTQLLEEQLLPPESMDCVTALDAQANKLQALIEALVKLSRLETGIIALHPKKAPVGPVVEHAVAALQPKASAKRIALDLETVETAAVLDPKWTEEAVANLVDNAIKYTPEGGRVSVSVIPYELFCRVDVTDTGIGIAEKEQAKIFGRFYRAEEVQEKEGVGIGLYLVRQIASGQGGYVKVKSSPGKGTTFSLFLARN